MLSLSQTNDLGAQDSIRGTKTRSDDEEDVNIAGTSDSDIATKLEKFESALNRKSSLQPNHEKKQELLRRVSVLRVTLDAQQQQQHKEHLGQQSIVKEPPVRTTAVPKRRISSVWRPSRDTENQRRTKELLIELEKVEEAILKWSSIPKMSPLASMREVAVFRLSAITAFEDSRPTFLYGILVELTDIEHIMSDCEGKKGRKKWHSSKEAVRKIAALKSRLAEHDKIPEERPTKTKDPAKKEKDDKTGRRRRFLFSLRFLSRGSTSSSSCSDVLSTDSSIVGGSP